MHVACVRRRDLEHGRTRAKGPTVRSRCPPEIPLEVLVRLLDELDEYLSWVKVGIADLIASA